MKYEKTIIDKNKSSIYKKEYFESWNIMAVAKKYGYTYQAMEKYLIWQATKNYRDKNGIAWRRCLCCWVYRQHDMYYKEKERLCDRCKICMKTLARNNWIKLKRSEDAWKIVYQKRKYYYYNKWRIQTKIKVKKIIWYYDSSGKIKRTKKERSF
jgi:MinD superfamily P-loop ATPase